MPERGREDKMGGGCKKIERVYRRGIKKTKCGGDLREDMPERGKKTKCGGEVANNIERVCRRGIKKTKWGGGGGVAKKNEGGAVCWRGVKKTKCGRRGSPKN